MLHYGYDIALAKKLGLFPYYGSISAYLSLILFKQFCYTVL